MATSFTRQAQGQLAPAYQQQTQALQSQIPAIQRLYGSLSQNLQNQQQADVQNAFESASARGVLRSTIPVQQQAGIAQQYIQKAGELGAQQQQEIGKVQSQIGGIGVEQAKAIADLAQALYSQNFRERELQLQRSTQQQELSLQRALADRQFALQQQQFEAQRQAARRGRYY